MSRLIQTLSFALVLSTGCHSLTSPQFYIHEREDLPPVHLAVSPHCGFFGGPVADINAGIDLGSIKTIVSFGDSFTDGGRDDGSPLLPAVINPPDPFAGGRSANGPVWVEHVAGSVGATLMDYAQSAACTDLALWPSNPKPVDFVGQANTFLGQGHSLDPATTLYSIFFGINDWIASQTDGSDRLQNASRVVLDKIDLLSGAPTNGRSFLVLDVYGRGQHTPEGEGWKQTIYDGLAERHAQTGLSVAFVDFATIWDAVLDVPDGYRKFGYVSTAACANDCTDCNEYGWCKDPDHWFSWFGGHPSNVTHGLMGEYVLDVLSECRVL
ncbi:carbohydrate esterase family 16 protein [Cylindrobasidium torrendii FP15055 ss-10]|uniref:Carbohydrate esterase family 16 protein n=1 Tax=Cylindrobasidium torrendii FP15055 ss-10 TaxID=1314674 RepID=A0A0D7B3P0_9AGAR|nr:carbohydrate esterase family 16 protein [Cylindrobasidium torrendii FP15055 ss-10]